MKWSEEPIDLYLKDLGMSAPEYHNEVSQNLYTKLLVYFVYSQSSLYCIALYVLIIKLSI